MPSYLRIALIGQWKTFHFAMCCGNYDLPKEYFFAVKMKFHVHRLNFICISSWHCIMKAYGFMNVCIRTCVFVYVCVYKMDGSSDKKIIISRGLNVRRHICLNDGSASDTHSSVVRTPI